ncbi:hypothetical protein SCHPADRAFT_947328 [Schizopora paradoxa]|uniref:Uncharacterized protein n=1 Tax=Schizopora paradoxa TaxID=27342 RepID=A0A0H2RJJ6_9AGAM|nr:hypothetical protein SCHPADRAFT_947328 [Schizopora paradoxa]
MPPGRPRKYTTAEDRKAAVKQQKRDWAQRNARILTRRRRDRETLAQDGGTYEPVHSGSVGSVAVTQSHRNEMELCEEASLSRHLRAFVEGNPDSPAEGIYNHFTNSLDIAPTARTPQKATLFWQGVMMGIHGRSWGRFVYDLLSIADGDMLARRVRDFELALQAMEAAEAATDDIVRHAFEADPSGLKGIHAEARTLSGHVGKSAFILHDLLCCRKGGLETFVDTHTAKMFEYQGFL